MATPQQIKAATEQTDAARTLHYIDKLEKCEGFTKWLGPKIFKAYDHAAEAILAAHARVEEPKPQDIATYHGLHDIVTSCRRDKTVAVHKLSKPTHI